MQDDLASFNEIVTMDDSYDDGLYNNDGGPRGLYDNSHHSNGSYADCKLYDTNHPNEVYNHR